MTLHTIGLTTFFTRSPGKGEGSSLLNAFDAALWDAGVGNYNLLRVSSILAPNSLEKSGIEVPHGAPLLIAYGSHTTADRGDTVAASIGIGVPEDPNSPGVIMEHSHHGGLDYSLARVREMAIEGMALRKYALKEVIVFGAEITCVDKPVCAFAGCSLWR